MTFPSWREFREKISEFTEKVSEVDKKIDVSVGKKVEGFQKKYPFSARVVEGLISTILPSPFSSIAQSIFSTSTGSDEDKVKAVLDFLYKIQNQGEEHYNIISAKLDTGFQKVLNLQDKAAKEDTLLFIRNIIETNDDSILRKLEDLRSRLENLDKRFEVNEAFVYSGSNYIVSYTKVDVNDENFTQTIAKIASEIGVKLYDASGENNQIPFMSNASFDEVSSDPKLLILGESGSGKTRSIIEVLLKKINQFKTIYILNPENAVNPPKIDLANFINASENLDKVFIIWDNFPDDLSKASFTEVGLEALATVTSKKVRNAVVTLNPKYFQKYQSNVEKVDENFTIHRIKFDQKDILKILELYGENITEFKQMFSNLVRPKIDTIAEILCRKEPTPLYVFNYLSSLNLEVRKESENDIDVVEAANSLLPSPSYYKNYLVDLERENPTGAVFLYALKLSYELGITRSLNNIKKLEKEVFGIEPPMEPSPDLSIWMYDTEEDYGISYSMLDLPRAAVVFSRQKIALAMDYLRNNLFNLEINNEQTGYHVGIFFGSNIEIKDLIQVGILSQKNSLEIINSNRNFAQGLGIGLGMHFTSKEKTRLQEEILAFVERFTWSSYGLAYGFGLLLGENFAYVEDTEIQQIIIDLATDEDSDFGSSFGQGIGSRFSEFNKDLQKRILGMTENEQFASTLGLNIANNISAVDKEIVDKIFKLAVDNEQFGSGFGESVGDHFLKLKDENTLKVIAKLVKKNPEFADGFGQTLGYQVRNLKDKSLREWILNLVSHNEDFAQGFGFTVGGEFPEIEVDEFKQELLQLASKKGIFASSFAIGVGYEIASIGDELLQKRIIEIYRKNSKFAGDLGGGIGSCFKEIGPAIRKLVIDLAKSNGDFGYSFGKGVTKNFQLMGDDIQHSLLELLHYSKFADGFATGLGSIFFTIKRKKIRDMILDLIDNDQKFADSFGEGLSDANDVDLALNEDLLEISLELLGKGDKLSSGIGKIMGANFFSIKNKDTKDQILLMQKDKAFTQGFGEGIGYIAEDLDKKSVEYVFNELIKNNYFAKGFCEYVKFKFKDFDPTIQSIVLDSMDNNQEIGIILGSSAQDFSSIRDNTIKERILNIARDNKNVGKDIARGLGANLSFIKNKKFSKIITGLINDDDKFAINFGLGMGQNVDLKTKSYELVFEFTNNNSDLLVGLGIGLSYVFSPTTFFFMDKQSSRNQVIDLVKRFTETRWGFGYGFKMQISTLDADTKKWINQFAAEDERFADGLSGNKELNI